MNYLIVHIVKLKRKRQLDNIRRNKLKKKKKTKL